MQVGLATLSISEHLSISSTCVNFCCISKLGAHLGLVPPSDFTPRRCALLGKQETELARMAESTDTCGVNTDILKKAFAAAGISSSGTLMQEYATERPSARGQGVTVLC